MASSNDADDDCGCENDECGDGPFWRRLAVAAAPRFALEVRRQFARFAVAADSAGA